MREAEEALKEFEKDVEREIKCRYLGPPGIIWAEIICKRCGWGKKLPVQQLFKEVLEEPLPVNYKTESYVVYLDCCPKCRKGDEKMTYRISTLKKKERAIS